MNDRLIILIFLSLVAVVSLKSHNEQLSFSLVHRCQRSQATVIDLDNTQTLEQCFALARSVRGLALNYAPFPRRQQGNLFEVNGNSKVPSFNLKRTENRQHFWQQPQEFFNCHVLQCPENGTFRTLVNDSRFDYFSLYGKTSVCRNYSCVPEVGLFQLQIVPQNFLNASNFCGNFSTLGGHGNLAHVASANRTNALSLLLDAARVHLAYVGLRFNQTFMHRNDFRNINNESLSGFLYRAWAPGYPKNSGGFVNTSCVALTNRATWITVNCERKLPFICELYVDKVEEMFDGQDMECVEYLD